MLKNDQDWQKAMIAWLHDPPDKALRIPGHEQRALIYLKTAIGIDVGEMEIKGLHDQIASAIERLPLPKFGDDRAVNFQPGAKARCVHPLSGEAFDLRAGLLSGQEEIDEVIRDIVSGLATNKERFLALWRLLPERIPGMRQVPADTRVPDHSILQHMDATAGLYVAKPGEIALLSFKLSPVQSFIEASRKTQDLLSGSYILAWLTFHAMKPVMGKYGPTALIYPALRGAPLVDRWLRDECGLAAKVKLPEATLLTTPSLPNRFLAVVPASEADDVGLECEKSCRDAWTAIANEVRAHLKRRWDGLAREWDRLWDEQVESFFNVRFSWVRQSECTIGKGRPLFQSDEHQKWFEEIDQIRKLATGIPEQDRYSADQNESCVPGSWQMALTFSAALMSAATEIRHVPPYRPSGEVPLKCSLLGTYEQMGPATLADSNQFWQAAQEALLEGRLKDDNERLSAISLVKRFAFEASLCRALGVDTPKFRDTRMVAQGKVDSEKAFYDSTYYAVLMFDGDHLGKWLDGRKSPRVEKIYDPALKAYFEKLHVPGALSARRPVGPALHAAISEALTNFSLHIAPKIVEKHKGVLVYSGGDDVLALLPARTVLACAHDLRRAYSGTIRGTKDESEGFYRTVEGSVLLAMGPTATASAGIAVAHFKEDMRLVLQAARLAEKRAKNAGRDRLGLAIMRRSGERTLEPCPWDAVSELQKLVELNERGASDRWAYHLRRELEVLEGLADKAAHEREIARLIERSEGKVRLHFKDVQELWRLIHSSSLEGAERGKDSEKPLTTFTILCQSASFLARGKDDLR